MFDPLPADLALALRRAAPELGGFGRLRYCTETDSTNDLALALAAGGEPEGVAVLADMQRAGRGRRGRDWFSPPEAGLYLSTIVRPGRSAGAVALITLAAGVAAANAVHGVTSLPVELKWPNDLVQIATCPPGLTDPVISASARSGNSRRWMMPIEKAISVGNA